MARFDVYHPVGAGFVVDVQATYLAKVRRRVVVPLLPAHRVENPVRDLQPIFRVGLSDYVLMPERIGSVPSARLGPAVANIAQYRDEITRALDVLFIGF